MTKIENDIIRNVIDLLNNKDQSLDPRKVPHLEELRLWLDTYVIAPLSVVADENRSLADLKVAYRLSR